MTTQGCKECPAEAEIVPLRNIAIGIAFVAFFAFWLWFSWSPFFPSIGHYLNGIFSGLWKLSTANDKLQSWKGKAYKYVKGIHKLMQKASEIKLPQYFKIFVGFFQVTSSFISFQVKWPNTFLNAMQWMKATINFSVLSLPGVSCLWKTIMYRRKLLIYTLSPLCFIALLLVPVCVAEFRIWQTKKLPVGADKTASRKKRYGATLDRFWNGVMFTAFMLYPLLSLITLEPFNCQPAGLGLLAADFREPCPEPSSLERVWASFFIILYPIGIPLASIIVLRMMGVHRLAKEKVDAALTAAMISLYIKRTTSVESQKITQLIGPIGEDQDEFKRRVRALYEIIWPAQAKDPSQARGQDANSISEQKAARLLRIGSKRVKVKVLRAYGLPKTDRFGSIDPFCWISLAGRKERTKAHKDRQEPTWEDEEFIFEIEERTQMADDKLTLIIQVMDWDQMGKNTLVGQAGIEATDIRRIVDAEPGKSEIFELTVEVVPGVKVEGIVSAGCLSCKNTQSSSNTEQGETFQIFVQVESIGGIIAGAEISLIKEFSILYDANQVTFSFSHLFKLEN